MRNLYNYLKATKQKKITKWKKFKLLYNSISSLSYYNIFLLFLLGKSVMIFFLKNHSYLTMFFMSPVNGPILLRIKSLYVSV